MYMTNVLNKMEYIHTLIHPLNRVRVDFKIGSCFFMDQFK